MGTMHANRILAAGWERAKADLQRCTTAFEEAERRYLAACDSGDMDTMHRAAKRRDVAAAAHKAAAEAESRARYLAGGPKQVPTEDRDAMLHRQHALSVAAVRMAQAEYDEANNKLAKAAGGNPRLIASRTLQKAVKAEKLYSAKVALSVVRQNLGWS